MDISEDVLEDIMRRTANAEEFGWIASYHGLEAKDLRHYIFTDDVLKQRFYDAQEIGSEALVDEALKTAKTEEDPVRAKIIIDTIKFMAEARAKERYGKQAKEMSININLLEAMDTANKRLIDMGNIIKAEKLEHEGS